jgi:N-acetylglucosaminyl-diphospho-decaprenol L-rhamnosyltransferase
LASVAIVIVTYNSGELLRRCLAVVGNRYAEVVVVDNASPDRQTARVCAEFGHVRLIERAHNGGFATAANAGVAATEAPWVLLLNPDAWPLGDGVDALLVRAERDSRVGALGPLLVDERGRPSRSTIRPPLSPAALALWAAVPKRVSRAYDLWRRATRRRTADRLRAGEFLQGAALLLRREAFEGVGGFDESFFMYGEDADLCARLRVAGWTIELCSDATFVHVGGGSSRADGERMRIELLRSWLRLIAKRDGIERAERARRWLQRSLGLTGEHDAAAWAASGPVGDLLGLTE